MSATATLLPTHTAIQEAFHGLERADRVSDSDKITDARHAERILAYLAVTDEPIEGIVVGARPADPRAAELHDRLHAMLII